MGKKQLKNMLYWELKEVFNSKIRPAKLGVEVWEELKLWMYVVYALYKYDIL